MNDVELCRRVGRGDLAAFEALYRRYVDRVWRYARSRAGSRSETEDIVQESFLRVRRFAKGYDGRSALGTWIFAVTRSAALDYARRERRQRARDAVGGIIRFSEVASRVTGASRAGTYDVGAADAAEREREQVRVAVSRLPGGQRDAIVMFELCGMSVREVCEALKWRESRVKSALYRGRRRLREMLKDTNEAASSREL